MQSITGRIPTGKYLTKLLNHMNSGGDLSVDGIINLGDISLENGEIIEQSQLRKAFDFFRAPQKNLWV